MKKIYLLATALAALVSCSSDDFVGDASPTPGSEEVGEAIAFGGGFKAVTRADKYDKDAADLLGSKFIVTGVKGNGTGTDQAYVFKSYTVDWAQNTAGQTESNSSDWEYVGKTHNFGLVSSQTIKYWDFSTTAYDFAAYSVGGNTLVAKTTDNIGTGDVTGGEVWATPIEYTATEITPSTDPKTYQIASAYQLRGSAEDLAECYITDMKTVNSSAYKNVVELQFRSLATKVRMAIYETVPGYSVKDVNFYTSDVATVVATGTGTGELNNTDATLIGGTGAFYPSGTCTVSFPHIGSANSGNSDYNKAHVSIVGAGEAATTQAFGSLNYTTGEGSLSSTDGFLQRTSQNPSFAGTTEPYYVTMLPNEEGKVLELRVNYTLVSNDGSGEVMTIHGAKAFVPAIYAKWLPNYAYTYIFKISDNTNGWTNPDNASDDTKAGLFPITFDAVVLDPILATTEQTTITTVAMPSITTYQKGHVYSASNEYVAGDIYVQVMQNSTLVTDLNHKESSAYDKSFLYTVDATNYTIADLSEAAVMDALNIQEGVSSGVITGRNKIKLTPADFDPTVTAIPGEDGNDIVVTAGQAVKFAASTGTYAYVYLVNTGSGTPVITTIYGGEAPTDWPTGYYTDANCNTAATGAFSATTKYYKKYTNNNNVYGVKIIKVQ